MIYKASYARKEGLGNAYIGKISLPVFVISTAVGTVIMAGILVFSGSLWLIFVPFICLLFAFGFRRYIEEAVRLTGHILGAGSELTEIIYSYTDEHCRYIFAYIRRSDETLFCSPRADRL